MLRTICYQIRTISSLQPKIRSTEDKFMWNLNDKIIRPKIQLTKYFKFKSFILLTAALCVPVFTMSNFTDDYEKIKNTLNIDALAKAEEAIAKSHGFTVQEMKQQTEDKCFRATLNRTYSDDGVFSSSAKRKVVENSCTNIALAGPSEIEFYKKEGRVKFFSSLLASGIWRILIASLLSVSILISVSRFANS